MIHGRGSLAKSNSSGNLAAVRAAVESTRIHRPIISTIDLFTQELQSGWVPEAERQGGVGLGSVGMWLLLAVAKCVTYKTLNVCHNASIQ